MRIVIVFTFILALAVPGHASPGLWDDVAHAVFRLYLFPDAGAGMCTAWATAPAAGDRDIPQAMTLYVTRYTERVTVTATITMPDGRVSRGRQSAAVAWYAGYAPLPCTPGLPIPGVPITTSQSAAEQHAVQTMAAELATQAADLIRGAAPVSPTPTP